MMIFESGHACTLMAVPSLPLRLIFQSYVVTAMYIPIQFLKRELVKLRQSQSLSDDLTSDSTQKKQNGSNFVLLPLPSPNQRLVSFFSSFQPPETSGRLV